MISFNNVIFFYVLDAITGNPVTPGAYHSSNGGEVWTILEVDNYLILVFDINDATIKYMISCFDPITGSPISEFESTGTDILGMNKVVYQGTFLLFMSGKNDPKFVSKRMRADQLDTLTLLESKSSPRVNVSTQYFAQNYSFPTPLNYTTQTFSASGSIATTVGDLVDSQSLTYMTSYHNEDYTGNILADSKVNLNFTWACSHPLNVTTIIFSLSQLDGEAIPDWVYIDTMKEHNNQINEELALNKTPVVEEVKLYKFSLKIESGGEARFKKFYIYIGPCEINNCKTCSSGNYSLCQECDLGYSESPTNGRCNKVENTEATVFVQALFSIGVIATIATSITSLSSPNGIYSIINQLQLYALLPMVGSFLTAKVANVILGMDFTLLSFDFMQTRIIWPFCTLNNCMSYPQEDSYLENLGYRSGSSLINTLPILCILIFLMTFHLLLLCISCACKKTPSNTKRKTILLKLLNFFQFSIYLRSMLESLMFILTSTTSELTTPNFTTPQKTLSTSTSLLLPLFLFSKPPSPPRPLPSSVQLHFQTSQSAP
ncbi:unnamed protein product [Moneuplotes crassus]|uniref:Uncharacterized protein n=1 Tax=Euplotes crassus TaxID=5936 RepID=A0AAD1XMD9_EUPCR|nr:unnamed protein product [Moneuplotes crassus]